MKKQYKFLNIQGNALVVLYADFDHGSAQEVVYKNFLHVDKLHRLDGPAMAYYRYQNELPYLESSRYNISDGTENFDYSANNMNHELYYIHGEYVGKNLKIYNQEQLQNYLIL